MNNGAASRYFQAFITIINPVAAQGTNRGRMRASTPSSFALRRCEPSPGEGETTVRDFCGPRGGQLLCNEL